MNTISKLPTLTTAHIITDPADPNVTYYMHDIAAYEGYDAETVSLAAAESMISDECIVVPHFYRLRREDRTCYYVPDANGEHSCSTQAEAFLTLREVIAECYGVDVSE